MSEMQTEYPAHRDSRESLTAWREAQPDNAFLDDAHFRRTLEVYRDPQIHDDLDDDLEEFGAEVAGPIDELARQNDRPGHHPELDRWSDFGQRTEQIAHHPSYHEVGRRIYGSGVMAAYRDAPNSVGALSRFYLSSYNGEAGHNCPLACTAGVIRVLQHLAPDRLRDRYLDGFLNPDYDEHLEGAQFMTEIQGGSDVGQNATRARRADDGSWRLWGEKWFCSNVDADVFLMTARFADDVEGTSGLGLFFVPRRLEDGELNNFRIRRLKDKIGTRAMASAECDFEGAVAYHMGPEEEGFKNMMRHVINTSRLYNAFACLGSARRAYVTAQTYSRFREAFGRPIVQYPLIQETIADVKAEVDAAVSGSMYLAALQDRIDADLATEAGEDFFRMALNLNKVRTAKLSRWAATRGIEVLGGNGAIETFSVLPRLLRDSIVTENWEGTHNTLQMQVMRDIDKYGVHEGFFEILGELVESSAESEGQRAETVRREMRQSKVALQEVASMDEEAATLQMRPLMDRLARLMYASVRLWERSQYPDAPSDVDDASLDHFIGRHVGTRPDPEDRSHRERLALLAGID
jgi:alkylation response protein AidB-like acyl-CoA dehydrogenase